MTVVSVKPHREPPPAGFLRAVNRAIGWLEHGVAAASLFILVGMATAQAVSSKILSQSIEGADEVIRYMVFFLAMSGAALAAQRARMIGMDVITHLLGGRSRALLRLLTTAIVLFACIILARAGLDVRASEQGLSESSVYLSRNTALLALPVGAVLIALHYCVASAIDVCYLLRGLDPPELEQSPLH